MEFTGRILKVLPQRSGISQKTGNEWKSQPFIFEYFENPTDRWSDKVLLETMNENIIAQIEEGVEVKIGFGHNVNEYNGRTYNEVRMYKFELVKEQEPAPTEQPVQESTPTPSPTTEEQDPLPF